MSPVVESEDFAPDVKLGPGGAVYVSGRHTAFGSTANATIARLRADGTRDPAFALLRGGAAYASYYMGAFNGYRFTNLVRLTPTGALDTSFRLSQPLQDSLDIGAFTRTRVA